LNLLSEKLFSALLRHLHEKRPETERNYKLFLSVYNFLSQRFPEILSRWRRQAYYAAWYLAEDKAMQAIMQRYLDYSKAFKKKNGFEDINICGGNENIFTIAYNLNAFLDAHIKSKILDGRNEKIAVLIKDADLNRIQNQVMLRYWSKYIEIQKEDSKNKFFQRDDSPVFSDFCWAAEIQNRAVYIEYAKCEIQEKWEESKREPLLKTEDSEMEVGINTMKKLGLPEGSWFVSLHVRDSGYYKDTAGAAEMDNYRDADIDAYYGAIKAITSKGGYVVRVGDPKMKTINKMDGLIDYAHSELRSNACDIYLFSQCRFFLGTSSGPILNPFLFGVPVLGTNYAPLAGRLHASDSLLTQKLVWSEDEKRFLTYKEVLSSKIGISWSTHRYKNLRLKLIDNSDEDITLATTEMMERLEGRAQDTEKDQKLQRQINSMYKKYSGYGAMGRIAKSFLEKADKLGLLQ